MPIRADSAATLLSEKKLIPELATSYDCSVKRPFVLKMEPQVARLTVILVGLQDRISMIDNEIGNIILHEGHLATLAIYQWIVSYQAVDLRRADEPDGSPVTLWCGGYLQFLSAQEQDQGMFLKGRWFTWLCNIQRLALKQGVMGRLVACEVGCAVLEFSLQRAVGAHPPLFLERIRHS